MPAGYSATPLVRKLGISPGHHVALIRAPAGWSVPDLPDGVRLQRRIGPGDRRRLDVAIAFVRDSRTLRAGAEALADSIAADGALWFAWPRRAAGHQSDVTEQSIRDVVLPFGLVDVKVAALDEDWSGLKVVWRRERRAALTG